MKTQQEISKEIRDQLRVLDPEISLASGTPERKIIDAVSQAIAEVYIDQHVENFKYDPETRFGEDLDDFLSILSFGRIAAKRATGSVTFSRGTTALAPVIVPSGTQVAKPADAVYPQIVFQTTINGVILEGQNSIEVPIEAVVAGSSGNVPANTITELRNPITEISTVTNENATNNGADQETDNRFRERFKQSVLRSVAGTNDQFLAIAISSIFSNKANIIGPETIFSEYIQIPSSPGAVTSQNPHSKYTYPYDYYLSENGTEISEFYYPDTDYFFSLDGNGKPVVTAASVIFTPPITACTAADASVAGNVSGTVSYGYTYVYEYDSGGTTIYGESSISPASNELILSTATQVSVTNVGVYAGPSTVVSRNIYRKVDNVWYYVGEISNNVDTTFTDNVITLGAEPPKASLTEGAIAFFEHKYLSSNSRNVVDEGNDVYILDKVDVYVSGQDIQTAKDVLVGPATSGGNSTLFVNDSTSKFHYTNYLRDDGVTNASIGNSLVELIWTPLETVPSTITIGATTYEKDTDYWLVRDITNLRNSKRARDGIELDSTMATEVEGSRFTIEYSFNRLPLVLNQIIDKHRQVGQDVLVHAATPRYFNINLLVMYDRGQAKNFIDAQITSALSNYFENTTFGTIIQISDIEQLVHNVSGVDNVRIPELIDVPQTLDSSGTVSSGQYKLTFEGQQTADIAYDATASTVQTALEALSNVSSGDVVVTGGPLPTYPMHIKFQGSWIGEKIDPITIQAGTTPLGGGGSYAFDPPKYGIQEVDQTGSTIINTFINDFYIEDVNVAVFNALGPNSDGPIQRTQNTWTSGF